MNKKRQSAVASVVELPIKFDEECTTGHSLLIKQHDVRNSENKSVLLVLNIPPYCNKHCLKRIFKNCGKIIEIIEQKHPGPLENQDSLSKFFPSKKIAGFHVAYITFETENCVRNALKLPKNMTQSFILSSEEHEALTGIKKWCLEYVRSWPDSTKLKDEVDQFMENYNAEEEKKNEEDEKMEGVPDEDGWIKVTKKGRNPGFSRTEANQIKMKSKERKRRKEQELLNVYKYQIRESKREKIAELRKKFEEDKQKIQKMKEARQFRPY